jgi:hypothetical protein
MKKDQIQKAANIATVGIIILWGVFMFVVIKAHL